MPFKCKNVPVLSNPTGIDKIVVRIQEALAQIDWMEYSFGRAYRRKETRINESYYAPFVYSAQREYLNVEPQDDIKAYCFTEVSNSRSVREYDPLRKDWFQDQNISVVVFANLELIDNTDDSIFTEKLIEEVAYMLNSVSQIATIDSIEEGIENAFSDYDYNNEWIKLNYGAFKINCTVSALNDCFQGNNFQTTNC